MQQTATSDVHPCGCAAALQIVCFLMFAHVWLSDTEKEEKWLTRLSLGAKLSLAAQRENVQHPTENQLLNSFAAHFVIDSRQNVASPQIIIKKLYNQRLQPQQGTFTKQS